MSFLDKLRGDSHTRGLKKFQPLVPKINSFEAQIKALSDGQLKEKTAEFKAKLSAISKKSTAHSIAMLRKISWPRSCLKRSPSSVSRAPHARPAPFRCAIARRHDPRFGAIAEMRTGEGKTLVATLPAYLNALSSKGVHIVTVNDYLSRRDAVWMGQIYDALGLSVAVINHEASFMYDPAAKVADSTEEADKERDQLGAFKVVHEFLRPCSRRDAYAADITYGTNVEFGFDYLRDTSNMRPTACASATSTTPSWTRSTPS